MQPTTSKISPREVRVCTWKEHCEDQPKPSLDTSVSLMKKRHLSVRPRTHSCKETKVKLHATLFTSTYTYGLHHTVLVFCDSLNLCHQDWMSAAKTRLVPCSGTCHHPIKQATLLILLILNRSHSSFSSGQPEPHIQHDGEHISLITKKHQQPDPFGRG